MRVGQKVSVSDRLFWVTAMAPLEVKFTLPERFLSKLHDGDQLDGELGRHSSHVKYPAKITQISPVVDPSSGTIEILAQMIGPAPDLRPGMLVNISLPKPP